MDYCSRNYVQGLFPAYCHPCLEPWALMSFFTGASLATLASRVNQLVHWNLRSLGLLHHPHGSQSRFFFFSSIIIHSLFPSCGCCCGYRPPSSRLLNNFDPTTARQPTNRSSWWPRSIDDNSHPGSSWVIQVQSFPGFSSNPTRGWQPPFG